MKLFDTHAHLDDEQFDDCRDSVVERASQAGVTRIVCVGTTADSSQKCIEIAKRYESVSAAIGIQPNYCAEAKPNDWDRIVEMVKDPQAIAIGETGLDRYWDFTPFEIQQDYFDRHIRLSQESGLPFIVHMRDCLPDIMLMLRDARQRAELNGVMHSYTGDVDSALECLELGLYISFAGMVTYKKSQELREVARNIPSDRILIETDAPYLSPHPKRGHRPNEPALLVHTSECLAKERNININEFCRQLVDNSKRLFNASS